jgi:hypothetical protein
MAELTIWKREMKMKLSEQTIETLKYLSTINPSILLKEGDVLSTFSPQKTIYAEVKIEEEIPKEAGIYDLKKFLSVINGLFSDPEIDFHEKYLRIHEDGREGVFTLAERSMFIFPNS